MYGKLLLRRLEEIRLEHGYQSWEQFSSIFNKNPDYLRAVKGRIRKGIVTLTTIEQIGVTLDLVPIALYTLPDGHLEDLGIDEFRNGESIDNYFGRAIKKHRKSRGLTQEKLSNIVSIDEFVSRSSIGGYEPGRKKPTLRTIELLSGILGLAPQYLLSKPIPESLKHESLEDIISTLEALLKVPSDMIDPDKIPQLRDFISRLIELGSALDKRYGLKDEVST